MTGRVEIDTKIRNKIEENTKKYPKYVSDYLYSKSLSVRTMQTYLKIIQKFIDNIDKPIEEIETDDVNKYIYGMSSLSDTHRATTHSALKSFFEYLVKTNKIEKNPFDNIERIKIAKNNTERNDYLTPDEIKIFINNVYNGCGTDCAKEHQRRTRERDLAIIFLFLYTGMRLSALVELNLEDLDREKKQIKIITKGKKVQEYIGLDAAFEHIERYLEKREKWRPKSNALFINERGHRLTDISVKNLVVKYSENIEGKRITPHKLRATYACTLNESGMDLDTICMLMGHSSVETTRIYIRGRKNKSAEAANIMSAFCE